MESVRRPLPLMKSLDDAKALCERERDNFYVTAFMIECWLGEVTCRTVAQHSGKKSAAKRQLQVGMAREVFADMFGGVSDKEMLHLFGCLVRFGEYDDAQSHLLLRAYGAMALEYPDAIWPDVNAPLTTEKIAVSVRFIRKLCQRLCDWVEAFSHWQTHLLSIYEPMAFDPDPDKKELAVLGMQQRQYGGMNASQKEWWRWRHEDTAERFKDSPKWQTLGRVMAATPSGGQDPAAVDQLIIIFWPLVKRHGWTYRDLMNVINAIMPPPVAYPCVEAKELAAHCANVLGLRKGRTEQGKSAPDGRPPGFDVAWKLSRPKHEGRDSTS